MYSQDIPPEILEAFKVPKKYKALAWLITVVIILSGVILSLTFNDWLWFARFGALVVIVSLLVEASGLAQKFIDRVISMAHNSTLHVVRMQVLRQPYMYGLSGSETEEQIDQIAKKEHSYRVQSMSIIANNVIATDIRKTEFKIGFIGTSIWAFGDLVGVLI
jgi:hypothetical protein